MRRRRVSVFLCGVIAAGLVVALSLRAPSAASGAASAAPSATAAAPPAPAGKGSWPPDGKSSERPTDAEWEKAEPFALERNHRMCRAKHVREWVWIECERAKTNFEPFEGVRVVGGDPADVRVANPKTGERGKRPVAVTFPVRPGDRRVIEIVGAEDIAFKSWTVYESLELAVSELWLPGMAGPVVTVN